ncbi:MAG: DUF1097 domain-containing protein [Piscinibacter sp.]|uniref:DUF1097 domain-containing protein n=1 Tax=Piscinibacter sp. TaxID=1903157 RepID=UPI002586097F|nr:DUF1097 domain-containing protein [Piscinibacter sp.]MCW5662863.1 DUF1097 domain-containing protein [Piscinibacter sp.]
MKQLTALAISIPVLGVAATYLALGPLNGVYLVWAAFIFWGAYFALGADLDALWKLTTCGIFGAFLAWVVALAVLTIPLAGSLGLPLWAGLAVGAGVAVAVFAANIPVFATIPGTVLGFASSFAYLLQTPEVLKPEVLMSLTLKNSVIVVSVSVMVGTAFGLLSAKWGAAMTEQ